MNENVTKLTYMKLPFDKARNLMTLHVTKITSWLINSGTCETTSVFTGKYITNYISVNS